MTTTKDYKNVYQIRVSSELKENLKRISPENMRVLLSTFVCNTNAQELYTLNVKIDAIIKRLKIIEDKNTNSL